MWVRSLRQTLLRKWHGQRARYCEFRMRCFERAANEHRMDALCMQARAQEIGLQLEHHARLERGHS